MGEPLNVVQGGDCERRRAIPPKSHPPQVDRFWAGGSRVAKIDPSQFKAPQCLLAAWGAKPRRVGATPDNPGSGCDIQEQPQSVGLPVGFPA